MVQGRRWCSVTRHRVVALSPRSQAIPGVLSLSQSFSVVRGSLASEGLQMWCEMIVPWMGHTKTYFPFAASEFRAADAPLSRQAKFVVRSRKMWCQVEVGLDGGVLRRTSPFRRTSLVPQIAAYHNKLRVNHHRHQQHQHIACVLVIIYRLEYTCTCRVCKLDKHGGRVDIRENLY